MTVSGTISAGPAFTVGTLAIGSLTLSTAGGATPIFRQDIATPTICDHVNVTGTVALAGTLELLLPANLGTNSGDSLVFIDNDGTADAVTGAFTSLRVNGGTVALAVNDTFQLQGHTYRIDYAAGDGNDVAIRDVTFVAPPNDPSVGGPVSPGPGQTQTLSNVSSGSVTLDGPGTLVLTGVNTFTGPTTVNAGTLLVNGSIVSPVSVGSGATLGGSGSTGTVTVAAGGTLSPGNSPGVLSTKDLSLAAGAVLREEIGGTATGQFDQLKVVGTVSLNGAKLDASAVSFFSPIRGNSFAIIDNDGTDAVAGTFAGLTEGGTLSFGARSLRISYHGGDGNDVVLTDVTGNAAVFGRVETSAASTTGAVYGLYEALLDRAPDPLGLQSFTTAIRSGASLTDVAGAILGSPEHAGRPVTGAAYVESLYTSVLNRSADAGGLAAYTNALATGTSQAAVAVQIATSTEAQGVLKPTFDVGVYLPDAVTAGVARLYHGLLNRAPDTDGLLAFSNLVNQGAASGGVDGALRGLVSTASAMLTSTEYAGTRGSLKDAAFVDSVYLGALGRKAEAAGSVYWTDQLSHGASRAVVATQIAESPEAQVHLVGQIELGQYLIA
ncbi:hypothetical protein ASF28_02870 [Methylobacterium sp. Leaf99]|nr:hypothetical protein ASF28_02870 [Methylobacterium sp. Leaf99]